MHQAHGSNRNAAVAVAATEDQGQFFRGVALAALGSAVPWALLAYFIKTVS